MREDRETIIVDRSNGGTAAVVAIIALLAVLGIGYLIFFNGGNGGSQTLDVDVPAVNIDVVPDGQ